MGHKKLARPLVGVLAAVAAGVAQIVPLPAFVRVVAALPLLGFIPGRAIMVALFPASLSLRAEFRGVLAVLLSLCIVPAVATVLDSTSWGIRPLSMILSLMILSLGAEAIGWWREQRIYHHDRTAINTKRRSFPEFLRARPGVQWAGSILFLAALGTGVYWTLLAPPGANPFTEFYTEPEAALVLSQPSQGPIEEAAAIPFTVANHENDECVYSVQVVVDGIPTSVVGPTRVDYGGRWQATVPVSRDVGADQRVELRLFREGDRDPYRSINLWIGRVEPRESGLLPEGGAAPW